MDPLEDVLVLLDTRGHLSAGLVAGAAGGRLISRRPRCEVQRRPERKLSAGGRGRAKAGRAVGGRLLLLTQGRAFTLRSEPDVPAVPVGHLFAKADAGMARAGEDVHLLGGRFSPGRDGGLGARRDRRGAAAPAAGRRPDRGAPRDRHARPGAAVSPDQRGARRPGRLAGLADPAVAAALACVHRDPARPWTVAEPARAVPCPAPALAERFKKAVGRSSYEYLTAWRIELAAKRLREGEGTLTRLWLPSCGPGTRRP